MVQYGICPGVTFFLLTILLRFRTNICPCWLDVMCQPRSAMCVARISLGLMINAGMLLASRRRLIFGGLVIALRLTGKSLSAVKWELIKPARRPGVSLVTETGMFLLMFIPLISCGPLLSLRCSARDRHCLRSLVRIVDWWVSHLVKLICCRIIWQQAVKGGCWSAAHSPSLTTFVFRSSEVRRLLLDLNPYGGADPLGMFPFFLRELMLWPPVLV